MTTQPAPESTALLGELVAAICARCPDDTARIMRAETLVALGHVEPPLFPRQTVWTVRSATDDTVAYHTTSHTCSCPDAQARERRCKHQYAVLLATALEDEQRYAARVADQPIPYTVVADAAPIAYALTAQGAIAAARYGAWAPPTDQEWRAIADAVATTF